MMMDGVLSALLGVPGTMEALLRLLMLNSSRRVLHVLLVVLVDKTVLNDFLNTLRDELLF